MARRRRHGKKGKGAIPVAQMVILATPVLKSWQIHQKVNAGFFNTSLYLMTGYDANGVEKFNAKNAIAVGGGLLLASTVGRKIANRTGANRLLRKATGGLIQLM